MGKKIVTKVQIVHHYNHQYTFSSACPTFPPYKAERLERKRLQENKQIHSRKYSLVILSALQVRKKNKPDQEQERLPKQATSLSIFSYSCPILFLLPLLAEWKDWRGRVYKRVSRHTVKNTPFVCLVNSQLPGPSMLRQTVPEHFFQCVFLIVQKSKFVCKLCPV